MPAIRWIKIDDKQPKPDATVLVYDGKAEVATGWLTQKGEWCVPQWGRIVVTHWAELPTPPKRTRKTKK